MGLVLLFIVTNYLLADIKKSRIKRPEIRYVIARKIHYFAAKAQASLPLFKHYDACPLWAEFTALGNVQDSFANAQMLFSEHKIKGGNMLKKYLLSTLALLLLPLAACASQTYSCTATHSADGDDGTTKSERLDANATVVDNGKTFTATTAGKPATTSPVLKTINTPDGGQIFSAKTLDGMVYAKIGDSYVVRNAKEGVVYSDCKPQSQ